MHHASGHSRHTCTLSGVSGVEIQMEQEIQHFGYQVGEEVPWLQLSQKKLCFKSV